ncbi:MAG: SMI1/KNR4 family protein [Legionellaceae bacterium]|nr:SMI1/KNR4 family protein [Legionellaceae bacterium]
MFDFNKLKMKPTYSKNFEPAATDAQIAELEEYCGHTLPENYKTILKKYNGGRPEARYFNVKMPYDDVEGECEIAHFYTLDINKEMPESIWWLIKNYSEVIGPSSIPFVDDGVEQFYYMKWVNGIPQVWFLEHLDIPGYETYMVLNSFDELLNSLYV